MPFELRSKDIDFTYTEIKDTQYSYLGTAAFYSDRNGCFVLFCFFLFFLFLNLIRKIATKNVTNTTYKQSQTYKNYSNQTDKVNMRYLSITLRLVFCLYIFVLASLFFWLKKAFSFFYVCLCFFLLSVWFLKHNNKNNHKII